MTPFWVVHLKTISLVFHCIVQMMFNMMLQLELVVMECHSPGSVSLKPSDNFAGVSSEIHPLCEKGLNYISLYLHSPWSAFLQRKRRVLSERVNIVISLLPPSVPGESIPRIDVDRNDVKPVANRSDTSLVPLVEYSLYQPRNQLDLVHDHRQTSSDSSSLLCLTSEAAEKQATSGCYTDEQTFVEFRSPAGEMPDFLDSNTTELTGLNYPDSLYKLTPSPLGVSTLGLKGKRMELSWEEKEKAIEECDVDPIILAAIEAEMCQPNRYVEDEEYTETFSDTHFEGDTLIGSSWHPNSLLKPSRTCGFPKVKNVTFHPDARSSAGQGTLGRSRSQEDKEEQDSLTAFIGVAADVRCEAI